MEKDLGIQRKGEKMGKLPAKQICTNEKLHKGKEKFHNYLNGRRSFRTTSRKDLNCTNGRRSFGTPSME